MKTDWLRALGRWACGLRRRSIVVDGRGWPYLDSGPGDKPAMLLLHGFGADKDGWLPLARLLRHRFRVIAPDLPGFGESTRELQLDYTLDSQSERLRRFCATLGLGPVHLTGNSLGGALGIWHALTNPQAVLSLTLLDPAGIDGECKSEADLLIEAGKNPFVIDSIESFDRMLRMVASRPPRLPGFIKRALYAEALEQQEFLQRIFWPTYWDLKTHHLHERLAELRAPTLIVWGRDDRLVDVSGARVLQARVPRNSLVILDGIGHVPMLEAPALTARHQEDFIAGLSIATEGMAA